VKFKSGPTKLLELRIKNGRVFKKVAVPLDKQGIVSIIGANGSGKSSIWSLLEVVFFSSTPNGERRDDLIQESKDADIEVDLLKGETPYTIKYLRRKGKWRHEIYEGDSLTDLASHAAVDAAKDAQSLLGMTQEEFEGAVHLTQNSQHILINGKPSDRKRYISDFFGIDNRYDQVQEKAELEKEKISKELQRLAALEQTRSVVETELNSTIPRDSFEHIVTKGALETTIKTLSDHISGLNSEITQALKFEELLPRALQYPQAKSEIESFQNEKAQINSDISRAYEIKKANDAAIERKQRREQILSSIRSIYQATPNIEGFLFEEFDQELSSLRSKQQEHQRALPVRLEIQELETRTKEFRVHDIQDLPILKQKLDKINKEIHTQEHRFNAISGGFCPTCGSDFESEQILEDKEKLSSLKEKSALFTSEVQQLEYQKSFLDRLNSLKQLQLPPVMSPESFGRMKELESVAPIRKNLIGLNQSLASLPEMEIQEEIDITSKQQRFNELVSLISAREQSLHAQMQLPEKPRSTSISLMGEKEKLEQEHNYHQQKYQVVLQELGKIQAEIERKKYLEKSLEELNKNLEVFPELKKREFFWSKMAEAYGNKGIRIQQLDRIMKLVMQRLPYYTSLLFSDKEVSFFHECDSGNISILVKRKLLEQQKIKGKDALVEREITYDVASMSGGEKKRLSIAFVLSLADCISSLKTTNCVILDEVDSNMDSNGFNVFVNDLLPLLKEKYSSVFVISHSEAISQAAVFDQIWRVEKINNWSTIEMKSL
jgi:DNA repair exonuclease SbcCD ATPase subunit